MRPEPVLFSLFVSAFVVILAALHMRYRNLQMLHKERPAALEKGAPIPTGHAPAP